MQYGIVSSVTTKWDAIQEDMHCCGANQWQNGYTDYRNTPIGTYPNNSVPDSCCHEYTKGCGKGILDASMNDDDIRSKIFVHGCLEILEAKLEEDVIPMMIVYAVAGVVLALVELITVVLANAFAAQITRRLKRSSSDWRMGDASINGQAHDETDRLNRPTTAEETVC